MKNQYKTPLLFASDLVVPGSPAHNMVMTATNGFSVSAKPFSTGKDMWDEKHRIDTQIYDYRQSVSSGAWTPAAEQGGIALIARLGAYYARYDKSSPDVQKSPRVDPPAKPASVAPVVPARPTRGTRAASSTRPSQGSAVLLMLAALGVFLFSMKRKGA